jgi:hypothetical protein
VPAWQGSLAARAAEWPRGLGSEVHKSSKTRCDGYAVAATGLAVVPYNRRAASRRRCVEVGLFDPRAASSRRRESAPRWTRDPRGLGLAVVLDLVLLWSVVSHHRGLRTSGAPPPGSRACDGVTCGVLALGLVLGSMLGAAAVGSATFEPADHAASTSAEESGSSRPVAAPPTPPSPQLLSIRGHAGVALHALVFTWRDGATSGFVEEGCSYRPASEWTGRGNINETIAAGEAVVAVSGTHATRCFAMTKLTIETTRRTLQFGGWGGGGGAFGPFRAPAGAHFRDLAMTRADPNAVTGVVTWAAEAPAAAALRVEGGIANSTPAVAGSRRLSEAASITSMVSAAARPRASARPALAPPPPPLVGASPQATSVAQRGDRRLTVTTVSPGTGTLQTALDTATAGDVLELEDGTYTGTGDNVVEIGKSITIRAQNAGQAVLDGEDTRRVISITSGTTVLEGLSSTKGFTQGLASVCARVSNARAIPQTLVGNSWRPPPSTR